MLTARQRVDKVKQWMKQNCNEDSFNVATVYDLVEGVSVQDCTKCSFSSVDNSSALFISVSQIHNVNQTVEVLNNRPGNEESTRENLDRVVSTKKSSEEESPKKSFGGGEGSPEKNTSGREGSAAKESLNDEVSSKKCLGNEASPKKSSEKVAGSPKRISEEESPKKSFEEVKSSKKGLEKKKGYPKKCLKRKGRSSKESPEEKSEGEESTKNLPKKSLVNEESSMKRLGSRKSLKTRTRNKYSTPSSDDSLVEKDSSSTTKEESENKKKYVENKHASQGLRVYINKKKPSWKKFIRTPCATWTGEADKNAKMGKKRRTPANKYLKDLNEFIRNLDLNEQLRKNSSKRRTRYTKDEESGSLFVDNTSTPQEGEIFRKTPDKYQEVEEEEEHSSDTDWEDGKNIDLRRAFVKNKQRFRTKYINSLQKTQMNADSTSKEQKIIPPPKRSRRRLLDCYSVWDKEIDNKEELKTGGEVVDDNEYNFERLSNKCGKTLDELMEERVGVDRKKKRKLKGKGCGTKGGTDKQGKKRKRVKGNEDSTKENQEELEVGEIGRIQLNDEDFETNGHEGRITYNNFEIRMSAEEVFEDRIAHNNFEIRMSGEEDGIILNRPLMDADGYITGIGFLVEVTDEHDKIIGDENCNVPTENVPDVVLTETVQPVKNISVVLNENVQPDNHIPVILNKFVLPDNNIHAVLNKDVQSINITPEILNKNVQPDDNIPVILNEDVQSVSMSKDEAVQPNNDNIPVILTETVQPDNIMPMILTENVQTHVNEAHFATNAINDSVIGDINKNTTCHEEPPKNHNIACGRIENFRNSSKISCGKTETLQATRYEEEPKENYENGMKNDDVDKENSINVITRKKNRFFVTKSSKQEKSMEKYVANIKKASVRARKYRRLKVQVVKNENSKKICENSRVVGEKIERKKFNLTKFRSRSVWCSSGWSDIEERLKQIDIPSFYNTLKVVSSKKSSRSMRKTGEKNGGRIESADLAVENNLNAKLVGKKNKNRSTICEGEPKRKLARKNSIKEQENTRNENDNEIRNKCVMEENTSKEIADGSVLRKEIMITTTEYVHQRKDSTTASNNNCQINMITTEYAKNREDSTTASNNNCQINMITTEYAKNREDSTNNGCQINIVKNHEVVVVEGSDGNINDLTICGEKNKLKNNNHSEEQLGVYRQTEDMRSTVANDKLGEMPSKLLVKNVFVSNNDEDEKQTSNDNPDIEIIEESLNLEALAIIENRIIIEERLNFVAVKNVVENIEIIEESFNFEPPEGENIEIIRDSLNLEAPEKVRKNIGDIENGLHFKASENIEIIVDSLNFEAPEGENIEIIRDSLNLEDPGKVRENIEESLNLVEVAEIVESGDWFIENSAPLEDGNNLISKLRSNGKIRVNQRCRRSEEVSADEEVLCEGIVGEKVLDRSPKDGMSSKYEINNYFKENENFETNENNEKDKNFETNNYNEMDNDNLRNTNHELDSSYVINNSLVENNNNPLTVKYGTATNCATNGSVNDNYGTNNTYGTDNSYGTSNNFGTNNDYGKLLQQDEEFFNNENLMTIDILNNVEGDIEFTELEIQLEGELIEEFCEMLEELKDDEQFNKNLLKSFIKHLRGAPVRTLGFDSTGNVMVDGVAVKETQNFENVEQQINECGQRIDKNVQTTQTPEMPSSNAYTTPEISSVDSVPINISSGNFVSNSIVLNSASTSDKERVLSLIGSRLQSGNGSDTASKLENNPIQGVPFVFKGMLSTRVLGELSRIKMLRPLNLKKK